MVEKKLPQDIYRILYETSRDAIIILEPPHWRFVFANPATLRMFKVKSKKDIAKMSPKDISPLRQPNGKLSSRESKAMIEIALKKGSNFFEWRHKRLNGEEFFASVLLTRIKLQDREILQANVRDITEQKKVEERLFESEKELADAFDGSAIGMALVSTKGEWLRVNKALCKIVGYTEKELRKKTFQDITHPDDLDKDLSYVKEVLAGKILSYQMEKRYLHKDGRIVWVLLSVSLTRNEKGKPLHFISQIQDINDRKIAEEKLNDILLKSQSLVDALGELVYDHYVPEDIIIWEGHEKALGLNKKDMGKGAKGWNNLCHPDDVKRVEEELAKAIKGKKSFDLTYRFKSREGYKWFEDRGVTVFDDKGKLLRVIGVMTDVTDKIQQDRELKDKLDEVESINRLMVGRELKMVELKNKIKELENSLKSKK